MSEKHNTDSVRLSQVLAGALAAITAAVLGSTMGVAGTVIGAGLASVVSTVGGAIYLRSIQRTRQGVRTVRAKVVGRNGTTSVLVAEPEETEAEEAPEEETRPPTDRRLRWPVLVAASVLAFALGMLVITGVEWIRGEPLSGGSGTTVGDVLHPPAQQQPPDSGGAPETTTPSPTSTDPTSPTSTPPTSSTTPPTTTTTGSSTTTTTTTTTGEAPTTTTTPPPG